MKHIATLTLLTCLALLPFSKTWSQDPSLHKLFADYYEDRLELFPTEATSIGDNRFNHLLPNTGSQQYIRQVKDFYRRYLTGLNNFRAETLSASDRISYDMLKDQLEKGLQAYDFHPEYIPFNQIRSLPLSMATWGAGNNQQPFNTVKDYENWLSRINAFKIWMDTALGNFKKGVKAGEVLPAALVQIMIPQMERLADTDSISNIFYGPVRKFPRSFSAAQKKKLLGDYHRAITTKLTPSYKKLATYLKNEYLPVSRSSSGINELPDGAARYNYFVRFYTTTNKTPEEIYAIGLKEVDSIHAEMEQIKAKQYYTGTLKDFFNFINNDPQFTPFKSANEVLDAYRSIQKKIEPHLGDLFSMRPKTEFEIRQTEAFRAASASAQYFRGSADGKRPGIFYAPILDPSRYSSMGMEDLFLHEAIPGHHYQVSLQQENTALPKFRRFASISAFSEGWGLYTETLGKQLGLYTDPYQYLGYLRADIHRAIRLVVDVGLHTGKMSREDAIKYMMDNEPVSAQYAIAEIERYMADPGQALSYKIGQLKIEELRDKYKAQLGDNFILRDFHDALLKGGSMPLSILETYMNGWAGTQGK